MFFTVAVQTCNRADMLRRALRSLAALRCPPDLRYEILVVDNNSAGHTPAVLVAYHGART